MLEIKGYRVQAMIDKLQEGTEDMMKVKGYEDTLFYLDGFTVRDENEMAMFDLTSQEMQLAYPCYYSFDNVITLLIAKAIIRMSY